MPWSCCHFQSLHLFGCLLPVGGFCTVAGHIHGLVCWYLLSPVGRGICRWHLSPSGVRVHLRHSTACVVVHCHVFAVPVDDQLMSHLFGQPLPRFRYWCSGLLCPRGGQLGIQVLRCLVFLGQPVSCFDLFVAWWEVQGVSPHSCFVPHSFGAASVLDVRLSRRL